jgi:predicted small lipoprotein YifL
MRIRGAGRAILLGRRSAPAALIAVLALAGCGSKDFPNEQRAPAAIDVTAKISGDQVLVSPKHFGAGLVTFTVANLTNAPARFVITGPKDAHSDEIQPGSPGTVKVILPQGTYQAGSGPTSRARPATLTVGPERASPQNKVLLP